LDPHDFLELFQRPGGTGADRENPAVFPGVDELLDPGFSLMKKPGQVFRGIIILCIGIDIRPLDVESRSSMKRRPRPEAV
jgi:hypothetical protein